jgi:hypothetical protein
MDDGGETSSSLPNGSGTPAVSGPNVVSNGALLHDGTSNVLPQFVGHGGKGRFDPASNGSSHPKSAAQTDEGKVS